MASVRYPLRRVSFEDAADVIKILEEDGCCIATNFTSLKDLESVNKDVEPYLLGHIPAKVDEDIFPPETRWCTRVFGRSKTARDVWMGNKVLLEVADHFVASSTTVFHGDTGKKVTYGSKPILSLSSVLDIGPGAKAQPLHRDDDLYYNKHEDLTQTGYKKGRDVGMAIMMPGVESTYEKGATLVIPKSHLWSDDRCPSMEEVSYATMQPGEAFLMLGSLWHAGGANKTEDMRRPMHTFFFTRSVNRAEENPYLAYTKEEVLSWTPEAQALCGFQTSYPNVGHVDFLPPIEYFKRTAQT